ncbi:hypothetical protein F5B22DRAFT_490700 [Xylaria bambusicola]|uniref:uncharacterized protein n=1 Tax=Xylaria bambusicola TaxID=326684 RepID=UPI0020088A23|nr:uncharacterized protein F5B22DRAFT_490700 [Xylaria bambusicola]KAI0505909.1 hypothetical protein F5B22DRAFT_490700 [Xylaria bambusicola]
MPLIINNKKHEYQPIDSCEEAQEIRSPGPGRNLESIWRRRFYVLLAVYSSSFILGLMLFIYFFKVRECPSLKPGAQIPYSPAPVTYVNKWLQGDPDTPKFVGQPRAEMDEAWHNLLSATAIKLSEKELKLANNATSIKHRDGGYVGGLGISHSLHCVKRIKQYMHRDYYYQGEQQWDELFFHADHCLESLRQAVMCAADVSVYTLEWTPHSRYKPAVRVPQPHACVDWEALHDWMSKRAASLEDVVGPPEILFKGNETATMRRG